MIILEYFWQFFKVMGLLVFVSFAPALLFVRLTRNIKINEDLFDIMFYGIIGLGIYFYIFYVLDWIGLGHLV